MNTGVLSLFALAFFASTPLIHAGVFLIIEENHNYTGVIGNSAMPFLNAIYRSNGIAANYYANAHPSIGNYFMLTTGQIITNDDSFSGTVYFNNIVRQLIAAGKTWREYSQDLPYDGYYGGDSNQWGPYIQHHNPCSYFSDVRHSLTQVKNLVQSHHLEEDIANNNLPSFALIIPDNNNNGHNGDLAAADRFLQVRIGLLIAALKYNDIVIISFDESATDNSYGGGRVEWIAIGPSIKPGYQSTTFYQHQNCLRFMCDRLGISAPGAGANAASMSEFVSSPAEDE
jgi:phosphatidylinositol-3-phosphatase